MFLSSGIKPIVKLGLAVAGTPVETAAATSDNEYLAPGSNDYYYSANNKLLARISSVNTILGCTNVSIASAGNTWQPFSNGLRSQKVFQITPSQNGSNASYTVSLYFDNAELAGRIPSTLKMIKTNAATPEAADANNSIPVTPTISTLGSSTTVFTGNFVGFSYFFLAANPVILPISLLVFDAHLNIDGNTLVSWSTASEKDNAWFDVEVSRNGTAFASAGRLPSKGNAPVTQQYSFIHFHPQEGITYYRLKQTDKNGQVTYSRIVPVSKGTLTVFRPFIYPVPAHNTLHLQWGTIISPGMLQLLSADMRRIKSKNINMATANTDIDVHALPAGVYYLRIQNKETGTTVLKFVKD